MKYWLKLFLKILLFYILMPLILILLIVVAIISINIFSIDSQWIYGLPIISSVIKLQINYNFSIALLVVLSLSLVLYIFKLIRKKSSDSLRDTFTQVFSDKFSAILLLTFISVGVAGLAALIAVPLSIIFERGEFDIFIAASIGLLSIAITFLSMHYAFSAHKSSGKLVFEKGQFHEGFKAFISKISFVLKNLLKENEHKFLSNDEILWIKCLFLTPLLGHASLYRSRQQGERDIFTDHMKVIEALLNDDSDKYRITIITLDPKQLKKWYTDITIINNLSKIRKEGKDNYEEISNEYRLLIEIENAILSTEENENGKVDDIHNGILPYFKKEWIDKMNATIINRFRCRQIDNIPFQFCLITRSPRTLWESAVENKIENIIENSKDEIMKNVIISLVGSATYDKIVRNIDFRNPSELDINYLLNKLHSAISTGDNEYCQIINVQYWHLLRASKEFIIDE